jgi:hypothetical protein
MTANAIFRGAIMCNRLLAVLTAITVLSMAVVETGSAQQALTQSQAFSAGYATCPVRQVAIGLLVLYGVTVCVADAKRVLTLLAHVAELRRRAGWVCLEVESHSPQLVLLKRSPGRA